MPAPVPTVGVDGRPLQGGFTCEIPLGGMVGTSPVSDAGSSETPANETFAGDGRACRRSHH